MSLPRTAADVLENHTTLEVESLDNGILSCEDPKRLQKICDELTEAKIEKLLRKWLVRLPHLFPAKDRKAGFRYEIFM